MAMLNIPSTQQDPNYRYKMPKLISKSEGRGNGIKTNITNMGEIARSLKRSPEYTTKYFGCELGTLSNFDTKEAKAIVNGSHETALLQELVDKFIEKYVLCSNCHLPETDLKVRRGVLKAKCNACGHEGDLDQQHRLSNYIIKNPPKKDETTVVNKVQKAKLDAKGSDEDGKAEKKEKKDKKKNAKKKKEKSKTDATECIEESEQAEPVTPVNADTKQLMRNEELSCDSNEIELVCTRLKEFIDNKEGDNEAFAAELRQLQIAQSFGPALRLYCAMNSLLKEDDINKTSFAAIFPTLKQCTDKSTKTSHFLAALEMIMSRRYRDSWKQYPFLLNAAFNADFIQKQNICDYYSKTESPITAQVIYEKAKANADPFVSHLKEDSDGESSDSGAEQVVYKKLESSEMQMHSNILIPNDKSVKLAKPQASVHTHTGGKGGSDEDDRSEDENVDNADDADDDDGRDEIVENRNRSNGVNGNTQASLTHQDNDDSDDSIDVDNI